VEKTQHNSHYSRTHARQPKSPTNSNAARLSPLSGVNCPLDTVGWLHSTAAVRVEEHTLAFNRRFRLFNRGPCFMPTRQFTHTYPSRHPHTLSIVVCSFSSGGCLHALSITCFISLLVLQKTGKLSLVLETALISFQKEKGPAALLTCWNESGLTLPLLVPPENTKESAISEFLSKRVSPAPPENCTIHSSFSSHF